MARRVLYFAGYRLKIFEWDGRYLLGTCEFEPDADGLAKFEAYLTAAAPAPVQLMVDLIEEDFRRELIPHTSARERKVLISRIIDRHYRGEKYIHVTSIGRSKEGRRDDIILISALTNSDLMAPWLSRLEAHNIPLAGIWSLPLLTRRLLASINSSATNILILSQQIPTAHRESFFKDGQLMFSRQAKLERDKRDEISATSAAQNIMKGSEQIRIFLTNQRIMSFTEKLRVFCLFPEEKSAGVRQAISDSQYIEYQFIDLPRLYARYKLPAVIRRETDTLFAYLCAIAPLSPDHYAQPQQKQSYRRHHIDRVARRNSVLAALIIAVAASFLWLNSIEIEQQATSLDAQRVLLERRYQKEFRPVQQNLDNAASLQASVEFVRRLEAEAAHSPDALFVPLAKVYSEPQFRRLELESFSWKKYSPTDLQQLLKERQASITAQDVQAEEPVVEEVVDTQLQPLIVLSGYLRRDTLSYRDTVALMERFTAALAGLPEVVKVIAIKLPVDVRPAVTFVDESGIEQEAGDLQREQAANHYEIFVALALEPAPHE